MKKLITTLIILLCITFINAQTYEWAKSMGGTNVDRGSSITTDASGNIYTTGYFQNTVDFDPGSDVFNLTNNGYSDIFIQKLDASGNFFGKLVNSQQKEIRKGIRFFSLIKYIILYIINQ
jgi:hypothetical protein